MSPRFARTKRLAHPYWLFGMNVLYSIFWFAAFVGLSAYTNKGISAGEGKEKDAKLKKEGGCAVFKAGTGETKKACQMYKSGVGLAVFYVVLVACNHWNRRLRCMVLQTTHHLAVR